MEFPTLEELKRKYRQSTNLIINTIKDRIIKEITDDYEVFTALIDDKEDFSIHFGIRRDTNICAWLRHEHIRRMLIEDLAESGWIIEFEEFNHSYDVKIRQKEPSPEEDSE